ncbi:hypothetical protein NDU88_001637 [Pleurodeles waltl]|uniref:Uncharacterized protein n=1 Tax=Pleurodeles waltl TaxID=8319 RepID=A0AAV7SCR9_PLEWA|nr:hypothetical protein NDU88_001637 [Pleurodeles waltl]
MEAAASARWQGSPCRLGPAAGPIAERVVQGLHGCAKAQEVALCSAAVPHVRWYLGLRNCWRQQGGGRLPCYMSGAGRGRLQVFTTLPSFQVAATRWAAAPLNRPSSGGDQLRCQGGVCCSPLRWAHLRVPPADATPGLGGCSAPGVGRGVHVSDNGLCHLKSPSITSHFFALGHSLRQQEGSAGGPLRHLQLPLCPGESCGKQSLWQEGR